MVRRKDRLHPEPLPRPACFYQEGEMYPERIRQSFSNGKVMTYWAEMQMPAPHLMKASERIAQYRLNGGYLYRPVRRVERFAWLKELVKRI